MGRLIDVDEAIKSFEKYDSFMGEPLTERDAYLVECVLAIFDSRPTAYSVEAVVKELEERSNGFFVDDEEFGEMFVKTMPLPLVIEIVRGGRDENI